MFGLRKHIERLYTGNFIRCEFEKTFQIPRLRIGRAGNINYRPRCKSRQLLQERFIGAFARRIQQYAGFLWIKGNLFKKFRTVTVYDGTVGDVVAIQICLRQCDRLFVNLNADELLHDGRKRDAENTRTAVGVRQKFQLGMLFEKHLQVRQECFQDIGIVLEKTAGGKMKHFPAYMRRSRSIKIRQNAIVAIAQQRGSVARGTVHNAFPYLRQDFIDGVARNRTLRNIDNRTLAAVRQKTDGTLPAKTFKVRRQFRAVTVNFLRWNDRPNLRMDASDTFQTIGDVLSFPPQLLLVGYVLILTAAATPEQRTARLNALR